MDKDALPNPPTPPEPIPDHSLWITSQGIDDIWFFVYVFVWIVLILIIVALWGN